MARRPAVSVENNFRGGLITEATGLNFPENACTETWNCIHDEKGRTTRRPGFDYESPQTPTSDTVENQAISGFTWTNVDGDGSLTIRVQQIGDTLYFYNVNNPESLSTGLISTTIDLDTFAASASVVTAENECEYTAGNGYLVVVHPGCDPFYVTYDQTSDTLTATEITVQIRDLVGVDDSLDVDERPTATVAELTAEHKYNLFNQGWHFNSNAALTAWDTAHTTMPSNADVWWYYKDVNNAFDAAEIANFDPGTTPAPKGHYLLNVFSEDRSTASGISNIDIVSTEDARFSAVAFLNNRVFYGGIGYQGYSSNLYVTQIIQDPTQFGNCYQSHDPTAEDLSDLLPSDGAVVPIQGLEACVKLWPFQNYLFIFATNGIWALTGSDGIGFTATDYTIQKISSVGAINPKSFVDVEGLPVWWNLEGIWTLVPGPNGFETRSLTDQTTRTFYNTIPVQSKKTARGAYNPIEKIIRWVYRSEAGVSLEEIHQFDRVLNYCTLTNAFYPWTISDTNVKLHDCFIIRGDGGVQNLEVTTTTEGFEMLSFTGDPLTTVTTSSDVFPATFKFFVSEENGDLDSFIFADCESTEYLDWISFDTVGEDYDSYFITGYKIHSEAQRFFQTNYVFVFLEQETNASAYMQGLWEWSTAESSNRWSTSQQIYNSTLLARAINFRRLKVRGKGRALQLKFNSETGKPFTIVGWSLFETQNASI